MSKPSVEHVRAQHRRLKGAFQSTFRAPAGRIVMEHLVDRFVMRASAKTVDGVIDANQTMINEGARQCVLYMQNFLRGDSDERLDD